MHNNKNAPRVLIACEESGVVRDAFTRRGWYALSCDLLPTRSPGNHYQGPIQDVLAQGHQWDLMIAHPPCTYLSVSGMHWTTRGLRDPKLTDEALDFVLTLMNAPVPHIAIENPVSVISTRIRPPDQIVQPWMFGDDASKKTCLWLKELPLLQPDLTKVVAPKGWSRVMGAADMLECEGCGEPFCPECDTHYADRSCLGTTEDDVIYKEISGVRFGTMFSPAPKMLWANQTPSGQNKLGPSEDRAKLRSVTYQGIADAMAEQWGDYVLSKIPGRVVDRYVDLFAANDEADLFA